MSDNKNYGYRVYNYAVPDRVAYWLTRVIQKFNLHRSRFVNNLVDTYPYAYMSNEENRYILGNNNYQKKIDSLIEVGYISRVLIQTNSFGKPLYGYIPLLAKSGSYRYIQHKSIDRYYDLKLSKLSNDAIPILSTLRNTNIDISQIEFEKIVKDDMYNKYLRIRNTNKKILSVNEYYAINKWRMDQIDNFNNAVGRQVLEFIKEDEFGFRLHTIISNSPKGIRSKVTIDNLKCVEIDLEQSQPNISSALLYDNIGYNTFTDVIQNGNLYDFISSQMSLNNRDLAKNEYFKMAYGFENQNKINPLFKIFPDIKDFILNVKSTWISENPNKSNHSNYAFLAQRKESEIFRKIWAELNDNNIPFIPIHDSIITPIENLEYVVSVMYKILKFYLHPNIKLHITY